MQVYYLLLPSHQSISLLTNLLLDNLKKFVLKNQHFYRITAIDMDNCFDLNLLLLQLKQYVTALIQLRSDQTGIDVTRVFHVQYQESKRLSCWSSAELLVLLLGEVRARSVPGLPQFILIQFLLNLQEQQCSKKLIRIYQQWIKEMM